MDTQMTYYICLNVWYTSTLHSMWYPIMHCAWVRHFSKYLLKCFHFGVNCPFKKAPNFVPNPHFFSVLIQNMWAIFLLALFSFFVFMKKEYWGKVGLYFHTHSSYKCFAAHLRSTPRPRNLLMKNIPAANRKACLLGPPHSRPITTYVLCHVGSRIDDWSVSVWKLTTLCRL